MAVDHSLERLVSSNIITTDPGDLPVGGRLLLMKLCVEGIDESLLSLIPPNENRSIAILYSNIHALFGWKMHCFLERPLQVHSIDAPELSNGLQWIAFPIA